MKGLSFGELSKLFGILKQKDRQEISKKFKLADKVLKQILLNLTMVRNICAHNDRLFTYSSKNKINIKTLNYCNNPVYPNLYIIKESMKLLLTSNDSIKFEKDINLEIKTLKNNIKSIDVNNILYKMGFIEKENPIIIELKRYFNNRFNLYC